MDARVGRRVASSLFVARRVVRAVEVGVHERIFHIACHVAQRQVLGRPRATRHPASEHVFFKLRVALEVFDDRVRLLAIAVDAAFGLNGFCWRGRQAKIDQCARSFAGNVMKADPFLARVALHHEDLCRVVVPIELGDGAGTILLGLSPIEELGLVAELTPERIDDRREPTKVQVDQFREFAVKAVDFPFKYLLRNMILVNVWKPERVLVIAFNVIMEDHHLSAQRDMLSGALGRRFRLDGFQ